MTGAVVSPPKGELGFPQKLSRKVLKSKGMVTSPSCLCALYGMKPGDEGSWRSMRSRRCW